jgi:SAM-dependent methyltransferase
MRQLVRWMDQFWYPGYQQNWDDLLFRERILTTLRPESIVLDVGAGAGLVKQMNFRGLVNRVCGVDLDPRVTANPMLDEGRVADVNVIPYGDSIFDTVFADNVLEHLEDPLKVFQEVARVLKSGGVFLFKTPNKWHDMPTIARLTPHRFHQYVNRLRGREEADTFPTLYRANTVRTVNLLAAASGMCVERLDRIEGRPEYLRMNALTYLFGAGYERLVNASGALASLRILLVGALRKP